MQIQIHFAVVVVASAAAADFSVKFRTQFVFGAHLICIVAPIVAVVVASVAAASAAAAPKAFHATLHFLFVVGRRRRRRQRGRAQDGANEPLPDGKTN